MGVLATTNPTLADLASRMDADGGIDTIVEILNQTNEILDDMTFIEANGTTHHKTTVRSGLPEATWRKLNYGVQPTKAKTVQVADSLGMLEAYAEVDKSLADLNNNAPSFRLSEDMAHIEGMNQTMSETLFYGDTAVDQAKFTGLVPRYSDKDAENGKNIINAGGSSTDNTSIWLIVWGPNTMHGIYPKGSKAGLSKEDKGQVTLEDADGGRFEGYRTHYKWHAGFTLRDWRYAVRIANISVAALEGSTPPDLMGLMVEALHKIPSLKMGRAAFYMNRTVLTHLDKQSMSANGLALKTQELEGKFWTSFRGIPLRTTDAIINTEDAVSFA